MGGVGSREYESGRAARAQQRARGMGSAGMATTLALDPEHAFGKAPPHASLYLPIPPHTSPYLPIPPHTSPYLVISPRGEMMQFFFPQMIDQDSSLLVPMLASVGTQAV